MFRFSPLISYVPDAVLSIHLFNRRARVIFFLYAICYSLLSSFARFFLGARCVNDEVNRQISKPTSNPLDKRLSKFAQIQYEPCVYTGTLTTHGFCGTFNFGQYLSMGMGMVLYSGVYIFLHRFISMRRYVVCVRAILVVRDFLHLGYIFGG